MSERPDGSARSRARASTLSRDTEADSASVRPGASPSQNGRLGGWPLASLDPDDAALDALDAIGGVAELEHVAREALDGEILVDRADDEVFRLEQHLIVGGVGDGAARGERGHPGPRRPRSMPLTASRWTSAPRRPLRVANPSASICATASKSSRFRSRNGHARPHPFVEFGLGPILRRDLRRDLLRQHIERLRRDRQPVEFATAHAVEQRGAFDEIVARQWKEPAFGVPSIA